MGGRPVLDIGELVHVAESLESVVARCYGPLGGQVLFTKATGELLLTRDGSCILEALLLDHPIARVMVRCAVSHRQHTGDGAKSFVLLLAALLRAAQSEGCGRQRLLRALSALEPRALERMLGPHCGSALLPGPGPHWLQRPATQRILTAYMAGRVGGEQASALSELACELVWRLADGSETGPALRLASGCPDGLLLVVSGLPMASSRVLEGLVLPRGLVGPSLPGPTKALLVTESLHPLLTGPGRTFHPHSATSLAEARTQAFNRLHLALSCLQSLGVGLLLSGPRQPDGALEAASHHGLAVVHGLPEDQLALVSQLSGAGPVGCLEEAGPGHAVPVCFVRPLGLGAGPHLLLGLPTCRGLRPHCLVLCAPVSGLAQQHRKAIAGAYQLLGLLLPNNGDLARDGRGDPRNDGLGDPGRDGPSREGPGIPRRYGPGSEGMRWEGPWDPGRVVPGSGEPGTEGSGAGVARMGWKGSDPENPPGGKDDQSEKDPGIASGQTEGTNGRSGRVSQAPGLLLRTFTSMPSHLPPQDEVELPDGSVLPPGGTFEFLLHHLLLHSGTKWQGPEVGMAHRLLAQALFTLPRHLHHGVSRGREFLRAHANFSRRLREGRLVPEGQGPLEVVAHKCLLVASTLQCLRCLLAADAAIAVRGRLVGTEDGELG
ncbi:Bardet-Biedl syndrome 10 protein isoform X2 [Narcine bancroftii]